MQCVKEQTSEICLAAVLQNGLALQFVQNQTPEICMAAIRNNKEALRYVNQTQTHGGEVFKSFYYEQECGIHNESLEDRRRAWKALHLLNQRLPALPDDCMRHICLRIS